MGEWNQSTDHTLMYVILSIVLLVVVIVGYIIVKYNSMVKHRVRVEESFSTMDIYMKKRWDLIPNLVNTVKAYASHEVEALTKIVEKRGGQYDKLSNYEKEDAGEEISYALPKIFALSEAYPDLKANQNFLNIQNQLQSIEEDIANARKYYNANVREYNILIKMFPASIIASMFHFKEEEMFGIETGERNSVEVKF